MAFSSYADNLPGGDGSTSQAYVRSFPAGKTRLVSRKNNGAPADGSVASAAISARGRFVAFSGKGDGLPGANGTDAQVWVHDRETDKTRLISKANNGDPADGGCFYPSVSARGRFIAFESRADNLPGGNGTDLFVYVRDRKRGRTILVSKTAEGDPATGSPYGQSISSDGRSVVYYSSDAGLPSADGHFHIYLRDLERHKTKLVDRNSNGEIAEGDSYDPSISGNARFVAFESYGTNLPGGGTKLQIYRRDLERHKTNLVSKNHVGEPGDGDAYYPHLSGDGRYVVFEAQADNLLGGDGLTYQIYGRDLREGRTKLLSKAANGDPGDAYSEYPSMSLDGRFAAFQSDANNLGGDSDFRNVFSAGVIG